MSPQQTKMDHPQPISVIFPQIYPLLKRAAEVWIKDADVMDTLSSVLKQVISYIILIIKGWIISEKYRYYFHCQTHMSFHYLKLWRLNFPALGKGIY